MIKKQEIKYGVDARNLLDVFYNPEKTGLPVLFFIHGGSWMAGSKNMYTKLGENFADKGFVSVVISYRLFPETDVYGMADDCRAALKWCKENIEEYGGNSKNIFLAGHSAGGQLAAVAGLTEKNPSANISGFIIIDAFGMCANYFLTKRKEFIPELFDGLFGHVPKHWPLASPDKLVKKNAPPFMIMTAGNTYPYINHDAENFIKVLKEENVPHEHVVIPGLSHMQIIYEFENKKSGVYKTILNWIKRNDVIRFYAE